MTPTTTQHDPSRPVFPLVGASLVAGFLLPLVLALGSASAGGESRMTGAALAGWGIGWALIALLTIRFTNRPQPWALVPAAALGLTGVALILFAPGAAAMDLLAWVWPLPLFALATWLVVRVRRDVQGASRWLLYPVAAVLALFAIGGALETVIDATDESRAATGGQLVDVGGHRLFIACSGTGSPTVVLEGGLGQGSDYFALISSRVAPTTRVCAYDRAGHGRSEPASGPQDGMAIAHDLHALLAASGNRGPYVLAGHSAGGAYVRFFAAAYPAEVAGLVLLDSMSPHVAPLHSTARSSGNPMSALAGALPALARVGVARLLSSVGSNDLPADVAERRRALEATPRAASSFGEEFSQLDGILDAAGALPALGDRPLVVVTALAGANDGWLDQQNGLARLSTNVWHPVVEDLTHDGLIESAKGATIASDAIVAVVDSVRSGASLRGMAAAHQ